MAVRAASMYCCVEVLLLRACASRAQFETRIHQSESLGARATAFCAACSAPTGSGGSAWYLMREAIRGHERPSEDIREAARGT